jgi:integrase/recombinase XerD
MSSPDFRRQALACHSHCSDLIRDYLIFLQNCRALAPATIGIRQRYVANFLTEGLHHRCTPAELAMLQASSVHNFVIATAKTLSRSKRKHLVSSLRSFLRFAHVAGMIERNLVEAVPVITIHKLASLPRGISWDAVQKLLAAPNRQTAAGRRDYAILLIVATYGVRIGQVTHTRLRDIDWHHGLIHFQASKWGKPLSFPLNPAVAEAILDYVRQDRGGATFPELFLTAVGEPRPLSLNNHLGSMLKIYYKRAGIETVLPGTHAIRFAFAIRLMQQGTPFKVIADLLGHRSIDSTFIYTKVDVERLRLLAVDWPQEGH